MPSCSHKHASGWNRLYTGCVNVSSVNRFKNKINKYFRRVGYTYMRHFGLSVSQCLPYPLAIWAFALDGNLLNLVSRPYKPAGVTHALSVPPTLDHTGMPALHTFCQFHRIKTTQACRPNTCSASVTVSIPHIHAGLTHALSVSPSLDHTGMPALHTLCQCHRL